MDDSGVLGKVVGQLGDVAKKTGESLIKVPKDLAEAAAEQARTKQQTTTNKQQLTGDDKGTTQEVVKSLYEKSPLRSIRQSQAQGSEEQADNQKTSPQGKSPEEQKKLVELRQKLHKESYFDPTFNPSKKQEERPAEKVENEKKKEMVELQKKEEKKPPPLAVQRARNKTEMFPGASG